MTMLEHSLQQHLAQLNQQPLPGNEQPWLKQIRETALEYFIALGFPTVRQEDWKYTKVTPIIQQTYNAPSLTEVQASQVTDQLIAGLDSYLLVFVNGHFQADFAKLTGLPAGVILCDLTEALTKTAASLSLYLSKIAKANKHGFQALNTAAMQTGYFLHVPEGVTLTKPVQILWLSTEQANTPAYHVHNLVVAEANSQISLIENYFGLTEQNYWVNTVTEVYAADHAHVEHYKLLQESATAYHTGTISVLQQAHSKFQSHSFALSGRLVRSDIDIEQAAEYAECQLNGLYLANGKQHIDHHTSIEHAKAHGISRELYKGIITEQGRAVFNGKVVVQPDAQKIDAAQTNKNLLLSEQAEIDTKPQLEIYADDVRCAHGATVGQLDANELFYLRSRGLDEQTARSLLTFAFAAELLGPIAQPPLRDYLRQRILHKLAQDDSILEVL